MTSAVAGENFCVKITGFTKHKSQEGAMSYKPETPFDSVESSHQYVTLLAETIEEVLKEVEGAIESAAAENQPRRIEALRLVYHNLTKLSGHMTSSRRILNDLRTLRRLLLAEREPRVRSANS
jgi:hypothetical protein